MSLTLTRRHNVDRFGYLIPHRYGNLPMVGAVAIYRPGEGRFGRGAVAVEAGTTNLYSNPFFRDGMTGWSQYDWGGGGTAYVEAMKTPVGDYALVMDNAVGTNTLAVYKTMALPDATSDYTLSLLVKNLSDGPSTLSTYMGVDYYAVGTVNPGDGWVRLTRTFVAGEYTQSSDARNVRIGTGRKVAIAAIQLEQKSFATSFVDGTRAGGRLSYPKSLIAGLNALTVAVWTSGPPYWVWGYRYLVAAQTTVTHPYGDVFVLRQTESGNRISLWAKNGATLANTEPTYTNVWDGNWHLIVGVINKSPEPGRQPIELYVDGQLVASSSDVNAVPDLSNIDETWGVQVGHWRGSGQWNGLIDELLVLPYAASEEEIASWYEAQGPLPPHPQALLQWDRQTVRPAQMVKL